MKTLLNDESGFIVSAELVLVSTMLVLGLIVGMSQVRNAVNLELNDVAQAVSNLNQSYYYADVVGCKSWTSGSWNVDAQDDACDLCAPNQRTR
jgi:hypothetical protein